MMVIFYHQQCRFWYFVYSLFYNPGAHDDATTTPLPQAQHLATDLSVLGGCAQLLLSVPIYVGRI
jgi:hypothetical protein